MAFYNWENEYIFVQSLQTVTDFNKKKLDFWNDPGIKKSNPVTPMCFRSRFFLLVAKGLQPLQFASLFYPIPTKHRVPKQTSATK